MKSLTSWFVLIVSIAVLVSSCSSEDSKTASTDNTTSSSGGSSSTTELEGTWNLVVIQYHGVMISMINNL